MRRGELRDPLGFQNTADQGGHTEQSRGGGRGGDEAHSCGLR